MPATAELRAPDYRLIFRQTPGLLLVLARDFTMLDATDARLVATLLTREQTIGRNLFDVFPDNPLDPAPTGSRNLRASLEHVLATGRPDAMAVQKYDIPASPEAGSPFEERYWSPLNVPVLDEQGSVRYILHRVEDVTDYVRFRLRADAAPADTASSADAAPFPGPPPAAPADPQERDLILRAREIQAANQLLRESNEAMRALDRAKTVFFNNASHELRTPLMLVLGPLDEVLAAADSLPPALLHPLHVARRNARRIEKLVGGLLDFALLEASRLQARPEPADLPSLTRELAEGFTALADRAGLRIDVRTDPLPPASIDVSMWEKIVLNLLSNALKFTRRGEVRVHLSRPDPARLRLEVEDTGSGIPPEDLPRVFDRFYQVPGRRGKSSEGTGIGLALVKELVALQHGDIRAESELDRGTRFIVTLPFVPAPVPAPAPGSLSPPPATPAVSPPATPPQPTPPPPKTTREGSARLRASYAAEAESWNHPAPDTVPEPPTAAPHGSVLVVDDNADMREHLRRVLSRRFSVRTAPDVESAWKELARQAPDLVLTDIMMPRIDGLAFLRALRATPRWRTLPVMLLTARAEDEASVLGLESGADDYLRKPFGADELLARVDSHIKLTRLRDEAAARERLLRQEAESHRRRLEALLLSVTDGFLLLDRDYRIRYLNPPEARILGAPPERLLHTLLWDSLPSDVRPAVEPFLRQAMEERRPVVFEYHDPTIDRWFEKRACPSPDGVAALTVDVTTRRLAQKLEAAKYAVTRALASSPRLADASESVLRHLCAAVDAQVGCFWQKTPDGELLELAHAYAEPDPAAPDRFAEFLAFTRSRRHPPGGSLPGRVWIARKVTWIPDLSADPDFTRGPLAAAAGLVGGIGVPVSIDDDLVGVIELFLPRRPAPSEAAFRTLGAAGSEISQFIRRRLAEADQQRLSAIVHSSHDAIVGISPERLVTSWNRGAERLYGLSAADIIGHEITRLVPADHLAEFDALFSRVLRGERIDPFDTVRLRHDGSLVDISLSWSPIHADDGSIAGISSIARDITAQKRAELVERHNRELQEENRRALEANRLKSDFLASMSHELRTPLHGVIGFSEFLVDEKVGPLNPTQKEFLNDVLNSGRHLLRLINNILDLSKIEAGRLELFPELLHLADLVQEVCAILRPLAEQHQVALRFDPDTARFDVLLDPLRLRQILYNLLSNAVQYNRPGGLATLEILRLPSPTRLQFTVVDDGPGIAPEDHARIFEEFRQLGAPRSQSTGLGLAVTRRLVECMGGEITVASQPGRGSRFTVRLPLPPPPAPPPSS